MAPIAISPVQQNATSPPTLKTLKPLLRRATLSGSVRKRAEANLDDVHASMSAPPSPSKRARTVSFHPEVKQQMFSSSPSAAQLEKELDGVRFDTRHALEAHGQGLDDERYDRLKEIFTPCAKASTSGHDSERSPNENSKLHLLALTGCASLLGKSCSGLVRAILESDWLGREEEYVKAYVDFLAHLSSAQGSFTYLIFGMLVDKFLLVRPSSGRLPECPVVTVTQLFTRVHNTIRYLLLLVPSASNTLSRILSQKFPYSDESNRSHTVYVHNLTRLMEYAPELKFDVLALMIDRVVKIDVQMQVDLDDLDDDSAIAMMRNVSLKSTETISITAEEEEEDDVESDVESVSSDEADDEEKKMKILQSNVEKMDSMLTTLFSIYEPLFDRPRSESAGKAFSALIGNFVTIILPTYRSRHTQFLLFHFAQKSDHLIDQFAGECVDLAFNSSQPMVLKQSATAYLASFVSRGSHVLQHTVREVFDVMGTNLNNLRRNSEATCRGPDLHRYGTFYAVTQALLYVFCFRWRDLLVLEGNDPLEEDDDYLTRDLDWLPGIRELLGKAIYSRLNPLRVCAPSIVSEFAKIARHLRFMYVYPLLETNKKVRLSQFHAMSGYRDGADGDGSWSQMDAYFPFDPYQLPRSKRWIEGDYVDWKGLPGLKQDHDVDDEEAPSTGSESECSGEESDEDELTTDEDKTG